MSLHFGSKLVNGDQIYLPVSSPPRSSSTQQGVTSATTISEYLRLTSPKKSDYTTDCQWRSPFSLPVYVRRFKHD